MKENKMSWITAVLFMLTVWCTWNSVKLYGWADEAYEIANKATESVLVLRVEVQEVSESLNDIKAKYNILEEKVKNFDLNVLPFGEAFNKMHDTWGQGHVFDWRDNLYTTNLKGEQTWQQ